MSVPGSDSEALLMDLRRLGPWHLNVEVRPGITTAAALDPPDGAQLPDAGPVGFADPGRRFRQLLLQVYPDGLRGRSVLDCACNCGAYLFWARELGAERGFGFDIREHWIKQARFLGRHREPSSAGLRFEVLDLYDLPRRRLAQFDITLFNGIFYHLPDPVRGLRIAADMTRELLIVTTASKEGEEDGRLVLDGESTDFYLSGVYGLNWRPTGEGVMRKILAWAGFPEVRIHNHLVDIGGSGQRDWGRIQLLAARSAEALQHYDASLQAGSPSVPASPGAPKPQ